MLEQKLDLSNLKKALDELIDALKYYHSDLAKQDANLRRHLRAGTIQAFEFTYEIVIKLIRRHLEITEPSREVIAAMSYPSLIRTANEKGLVNSEVAIWKQYREKRNITSHTYDETQAEQVMMIIPSFINDSLFVFHQLQKSHDDI